MDDEIKRLKAAEKKNGKATITAEEAQAVLWNEKQKRAQGFINEYNELRRKYGLTLAARVEWNRKSGGLFAVIDQVVDFSG